QGRVRDRQRAEVVIDASAVRGGVAADGAVAHGQDPGVQDAAAVGGGRPVGDGQSRDVDGETRPNVEDPGSVVATNRDHAGTRAGDGQVLGNRQFAGRQDNRAGQARLEVHRTARWRAGDGVPKRVGAGVIEVGYGAR